MSLYSTIFEVLIFLVVAIVVGLVINIPLIYFILYLRERKIKKNIPDKIIKEVQDGRKERRENVGDSYRDRTTETSISDIPNNGVDIESEELQHVSDTRDKQVERRHKSNRFNPI